MRLPIDWKVTAFEPGPPPPLAAVSPGQRAWLTEHAGATVDGGLLRVHTADSVAAVADDVRLAYGDDFVTIAFDWMGRQIALDGSGCTAILDLGWNDLLRSDADLDQLFGPILAEEGGDLLRAQLWREWQAAHGELAFDECAGYRHPVFLGGSDDVANLERISTRVYWGVTAQLAAQV